MNKLTHTPALALALTAAFSLIATSTPSADVDPILIAPDPQEITILEELSDWVGDDGEVLTGSSLGETIRSRRDSFELFRFFHAESDRREQVLTMPYGPEIAHVAERFGVDALLLASVVEAESNFDPLAVSPVGAVGLMQVMPATAGDRLSEQLYEPAVNLEIGSRYLARLLTSFQGDLELALAAYNAGPGAVRRFGGVPPYRETRGYVEKVLSIYVDHHRDRWQSKEARALLAIL
jgi:hypothetical protein